MVMDEEGGWIGGLPFFYPPEKVGDLRLTIEMRHGCVDEMSF